MIWSVVLVSYATIIIIGLLANAILMWFSAVTTFTADFRVSLCLLFSGVIMCLASDLINLLRCSSGEVYFKHGQCNNDELSYHLTVVFLLGKYLHIWSLFLLMLDRIIALMLTRFWESTPYWFIYGFLILGSVLVFPVVNEILEGPSTFYSFFESYSTLFLLTISFLIASFLTRRHYGKQTELHLYDLYKLSDTYEFSRAFYPAVLQCLTVKIIGSTLLLLFQYDIVFSDHPVEFKFIFNKIMNVDLAILPLIIMFIHRKFWKDLICCRDVNRVFAESDPAEISVYGERF